MGAFTSVAVSLTTDVWVTGIGGDTVRLHVLPDIRKVSTFTSEIGGVTADEPLWAEYNVGFV